MLQSYTMIYRMKAFLKYLSWFQSQITLDILDLVFDTQVGGQTEKFGDGGWREVAKRAAIALDNGTAIAKVTDFGLSMRIDNNRSHVSNATPGTVADTTGAVICYSKLNKTLLWYLDRTNNIFDITTSCFSGWPDRYFG